jgi:hypothetical protein
MTVDNLFQNQFYIRNRQIKKTVNQLWLMVGNGIEEFKMKESSYLFLL